MIIMTSVPNPMSTFPNKTTWDPHIYEWANHNRRSHYNCWYWYFHDWRGYRSYTADQSYREQRT
jgi:hypothetical protein